MDGTKFAILAVEFTALAMVISSNGKAGWSRLHLYALAIELAFKSLALRSGASPENCKTAGHRISKMMALIERLNVVIPTDLKRRLSDDEWFKTMLETRYPVGRREVFFHNNYPEMIAQILEVDCCAPLSFEGGSAMAEIKLLVDRMQSKHRLPSAGNMLGRI